MTAVSKNGHIQPRSIYTNKEARNSDMSSFPPRMIIVLVLDARNNHSSAARANSPRLVLQTSLSRRKRPFFTVDTQYTMYWVSKTCEYGFMKYYIHFLTMHSKSIIVEIR